MSPRVNAVKEQGKRGRLFGRQRNKTKTINLALQGGGAHGAFTWGVLDRLLEDDRLAIEGISGASAGAMNAVVLASGLLDGGNAGARAALETFWRRVSKEAIPSLMKYMRHLLGSNPLQRVVEEVVDFERLRQRSDIKLFIAATNVRTGRVKIFRTPEVGSRVLLASACIPFLFGAVEIDGESYWDGGYMANPALLPLIDDCNCLDMVIVQVNPLTNPRRPISVGEIFDRFNQISMNCPMVHELQAIDYARRMSSGGFGLGGRLQRKAKKLRLHLIQAEEQMSSLGFSSKLNAEWRFMCFLREVGRQRAQEWLDENFHRIGVESSFELELDR